MILKQMLKSCWNVILGVVFEYDGDNRKVETEIFSYS